MGHHIKTLSVNSNLRNEYKLNVLNNLSKVNIFVGSNNSGKSRFLRRIFAIDGSLSFLPPEEMVDVEKYYNNLIEFTDAIISLITKSSLGGIGNLNLNELISEIEDSRLTPFLKEDRDLFKDFYRLVDEINELNTSSIVTINTATARAADTRDQLMDQLIANLKALPNVYQSKIVEIPPSGRTSYKINFKRVYIPTLRGLRGYSDTIDTGKDVYKERTKNDYFKEASKALEIHTGLNLYDEITDMLLGTVQQRYNMLKFQEFLSESFFDRQQVTLTPVRDSDVIKVKIGTEKEKNIFELGDGIQSLIILTFPLFKFLEENLLLFIEEPELYLHPGMQRKFIEVIMDEQFSHHQFFFTTHSNHFLDMTLDIDMISVYKFNKELGEHSGSPTEELDAAFSIENVSNEDKSVLQELGVRNSAVLLSNCTIWVEGITDRFYIRQFLKVFQEYHSSLKQFKEDIHYSFVEYSGGNITHWSFLENETEADARHASMNAEKICSTLFLISDKDGDDKRPRQEKLKEILGERYYCLECKEIENILSADTIRKVIAEYEKSTLEHLAKKDFTQEEYNNMYLGTFINSLFEEGARKRRGSYAADSGTIVNKLDFCKKAIDHITTYAQLSEEAQKLSQVLYNFIKGHNE
ncbi:AAA family ATPase [Oceanobacillus jordanicus]|uniref:AAA family ATPase n=1 Tax=Oceanobacillus jordanicus TaxID=2867266 RepID=A0AAW5B8T0_9BACI|nr:AAA family ATPase [Oceanobacillus jordanicus]MCG3420395.1 AAA family ATPase [Oceanobacillus jordanicus]